MGWMDNSGKHEGWIAKVCADGQEASASSGLGILVWPNGDIKREELRPYSAIVAWQIKCECGWIGSRYDLENERPENIDGQWNEPTEDREEQIINEWREHVRPDNALDDLERLAEQAHALNMATHAGVDAARTAGATWDSIGNALGISRQAAHQRFSGL